MMFHIKFPRFRGFYSWDELGCLARALGFPKDLFKDNVTDEIAHEDNGLPDKEVLRMLDYKMLYKSLHLSLNNHTAEWNFSVIRRALDILDKQGLTFEDLYNARLAYQAYEASDMKGMVIEQHRILRTLKMCGKTISPMKLMHRVKHSKDSFEEAGRMQLYEFLDLILWANEYEPFTPQKTYGHFEMEDEMFKLVDFDQLLSHHDQRLANRLDQQYLKEEWTFSKEKHGDKGRFKEPPVACSDSRIQMAHDQKKQYKGLKNEVVGSQKMVYFSQQGFVRPRPVTAPNLTQYKNMEEEIKRKQSIAAHNALFNKYQKILKKAHKKDKGAKVEVDLSDKPVVDDYVRCETPRIVTDSDLKETREEFQNLMFNKETERARYEIMMDTEMDHYIPNFKDKWLEKKENAINPKDVVRRKAWEEKLYNYRNKWSQHPVEKVKDDKVNRYDNDDIINHLTYPVNRLPPAHAKKCDARFRGWYDTKSKKGAHFILVSPYFHNSPKGRLLTKLAKMSDDEINKLHGDFVFRYTKKNQVDKRPVTAPPDLAKRKEPSFKSPSSGYGSMEDKSSRTTPKTSVNAEKPDKLRKGSPETTTDVDKVPGEQQKTTTTDEILEEIKIRLNKLEGKPVNKEGQINEGMQEENDVKKDNTETNNMDNDENMKADDENVKEDQKDEYMGIRKKSDNTVTTRESGTSSRESAETSVSETIRKLTDDKPKTNNRSKSANAKRHDNFQTSLDSLFVNDQSRQPRSKSAIDRGNLMHNIADTVPMPYMDHSKPKVVSVGSIGKISLLESISESKYWEDVLLEELAKRQAEQNPDLSDSSSDSAYSDVDSNEDFEYLRNPAVKKPRKRTKSRSKSGSESVLLALILDEEKARRRKARTSSAKYSGRASPKSPLFKSPKSNRSSSSASSTRSLKSPVSGKIPLTVTHEVKENEDIQKAENYVGTLNNAINTDVNTTETKDSKFIKSKETDATTDKNETINKSNTLGILSKQDSNANRLTLRSKQNDNNITGKLKNDKLPQKQKKVVIINTDSVYKDSKKPVKKCERLVNRMDGTISKTLSQRLLSAF